MKRTVFSKRIFLSLITTAVMATMVSAQSNDRYAGWAAKMARKGQTTSIQSIGAAATNADSKLSEDSDDGDDRARLEGTWRSTGTFTGFEVKSLFTFGAGKNSNNGIVVESSNFQLTASPSCLPAQGVWKRTVERRFIVTEEAFCFDSNNGFAPAGTIRAEIAIRLNESGTEFSGRSHVEFFDIDGTSIFFDDGTDNAVRMRAEAPPR